MSYPRIVNGICCIDPFIDNLLLSNPSCTHMISANNDQNDNQNNDQNNSNLNQKLWGNKVIFDKRTHKRIVSRTSETKWSRK